MANKRRFKISSKAVITAVSLIFCIVIGFLLKSNEPEFDRQRDFVRVIDVGQAESVLIYSNGYSTLIDTGLATTATDILETLDECGIETLDVMMISHLHNDHTGGIPDIMKFHSVKNLVLPELSVESEGLGNAQFAINEVTKTGGSVHNAVQGMNFTLGEFEITVLASFGEMNDENNRSLFVVAEIDGRRFFFSGDAEEKAEKALLKEGLDIKCDVYKAGHHGSSSSSCEELLKKIDPRYAVISCGIDNTYGHPHNEVLARFEKQDVRIYRTDIHGNVTFDIEEGKISPKTEK